MLARKAASGRQQGVLSPPWKSNEFHSLAQKDSWPVWLGVTQAPLSLGSSYLLVIFTEFPSVERKYLSILSLTITLTFSFQQQRSNFGMRLRGLKLSSCPGKITRACVESTTEVSVTPHRSSTGTAFTITPAPHYSVN